MSDRVGQAEGDYLLLASKLSVTHFPSRPSGAPAAGSKESGFSAASLIHACLSVSPGQQPSLSEITSWTVSSAG